METVAIVALRAYPAGRKTVRLGRLATGRWKAVDTALHPVLWPNGKLNRISSLRVCDD
jgi:hypothetical protein